MILETIKRKVKGKKKFLIIFIVFNIASIYFGAFINDYSFIRETNPFTYIFGITSVDIEPTYKDVKEGTKITLKIENSGDKEVDDLYVNYRFCGNELKTAFIEESKMKRSDKQYFTIENVSLNTSCSPSPKEGIFDIYTDRNNKCYAKVDSPITETCGYCLIDIHVYGNGDLIYNETISYPFSTVNVSTLSLMSAYNFSLQLTPNQTRYPNYGPYDLLSCIDAKYVENLDSLIHLGPINVLIFDPISYCLQGSDPEWCAYLYTNFERK